MDVLPTGWVNFALLHLEPRAALVAGAVSAPFVVGAAWLLLQRQIDLYRKANTAPEAVEWVRDFENEPAEGEQIELGELAEPTQVATTADENALPMQAAWNKMRDDEYGEHVGDFLRSGTWLTGWNWQRLGWIERLVGRLLNEKERERIQFMLGSEAPTWSKSWRTSAIVTAVAFVPLAIPMPGTRGIGSIIAVIALLFGVPVLGGRWIGSAQGPVTGKLVPILSFYPVDYRKTSVAIWKVNLLRAVLWAPFGLALGILVARDMRGSPEPWTNGVWFTARVLLTVIAVMPVMVAVTFSKSSNDTGTDSIRGAAVLALVTIGGVFLLTLAGIGLTTPWPWSAAAIITLAVTAWAMWSSYGAYYEKGKVDLVRTRE